VNDFCHFFFFIFYRLLEVLNTISHTLDLENQSSMQFLRENILMDVFDVTSMTSPVIGIQIEAGKAQSLTTSNIQNLMADTNITIGKIDAAIILPVELINSEFCFVKLTSSLRKFYSRHHDVVDRYGVHFCICITNDHGDVPLVVNTSRSFPHS